MSSQQRSGSGDPSKFLNFSKHFALTASAAVAVLAGLSAAASALPTGFPQDLRSVPILQPEVGRPGNVQRPARPRTPATASRGKAAAAAHDAAKPKGPLQIVISLDKQQLTLYAGSEPIAHSRVSTGVPGRPTPTGVFSILRRVPNETMDSMTLGIPHNSPYGYLVKNVLYTQYFTPDGASLHDNYWSSNFGGVGSHGCLGLSLADSRWLWDWASIGTPVVVNP